jgi:hypothetical protein
MRTGLILALLFTLGVAANLHFGRRGQLATVRACGEKTFGEVRVLEMCSDL